MMGSTLVRPRQESRIEREYVVLVEGQDEANLFRVVLDHYDIRDVQVMEAGGKDKFKGILLTSLADAKTRGINLRSIGVVRDADTSGETAFESVCGALRNAGLPVPAQPFTLVRGTPNVAVLILPHDETSGSVEDVCWRAIQGLPIAKCIEQYVACLTQCGEMRSPLRGKTMVHAYLASRNDPTTTVGLGAKKGYWPIEHEAFAMIKTFAELLRESAAS